MLTNCYAWTTEVTSKYSNFSFDLIDVALDLLHAGRRCCRDQSDLEESLGTSDFQVFQGRKEKMARKDLQDFR